MFGSAGDQFSVSRIVETNGPGFDGMPPVSLICGQDNHFLIYQLQASSCVVLDPPVPILNTEVMQHWARRVFERETAWELLVVLVLVPLSLLLSGKWTLLNPWLSIS